MNNGSFDPSVEFSFTKHGSRRGVKEQFYAATDYNRNHFSYRTIGISSDGQWRFTFHIPIDFQSLISLTLVGFSEDTVNDVDIDLYSDYALIGEDCRTNIESDNTGVYSFVDRIITELDISSVFSNLQAGHYCGVRVDHNLIGTRVNYFGVRLVYRGSQYGSV